MQFLLWNSNSDLKFLYGQKSLWHQEKLEDIAIRTFRFDEKDQAENILKSTVQVSVETRANNHKKTD